jgi:hypothetical protein
VAVKRLYTEAIGKMEGLPYKADTEKIIQAVANPDLFILSFRPEGEKSLERNSNPGRYGEEALQNK